MVSGITSKEKVESGRNASKIEDARDPSKSSEYQPYDFGNADRPLTYLAALLHFMKYIIGTGILAIPFVFMNVGYVTGLVGMAIVGFLYIHVIHMLLATEYELCKRLRVPSLTYVEVVERTFDTAATKAHKLALPVVGFVYFNYVFNGIMGNAAYLLVIAANMKCVYDGYNRTDVDIQYFITAAIAPLTLLCWIPKLRFLTPFSMLTNVFNVVNIILISVSPLRSGTRRGTPRAYNGLAYFPQFFAVVLGAITGTGFVFPVKNDMAKPSRFASAGGIVNVSMLVSGTVYALFGLINYLKYGEATQGNVLLNLPAETTLSMMVFSMYTLAVCISYTLNFYICFDTVWTNYLGREVVEKHVSENNIFLLKNGLKTCICAVSYLIAVGIPRFELFTALTGSFGVLAEICIPPLLQILMNWSTVREGWTVVILLKNCLIIALGLFLCLSGFASSLWDILVFYDMV